MEKTSWKITLANGAIIDGLERNGSCFISEYDVPNLDGILNKVICSAHGETDIIYNNAVYVPCASIDNRTWFTFRELSVQELFEMDIKSKIDYLSMMTDVDLG